MKVVLKGIRERGGCREGQEERRSQEEVGGAKEGKKFYIRS